MPFLRTPGVCLRKIDFSETSQVLHFFTRDHGKVACIAKGAKRRRGPFQGPFDILRIYDLIRIEKRPGTLDILTQAQTLRVFRALPADYGRFSAACYAAEFVDEFAPEGVKNEPLYDRLTEIFERLDTGMSPVDAIYSFEVRALGALGYLPRARECGVCRRAIDRPEAYFSVRDGGAVCQDCRVQDPARVLVKRAALESIARFAEGAMPKEPMKRPLAVEIRRILDLCARYHLERELKGARFMRDLAASAVLANPEGRETP